jgi:hypothetical protein
MEGNHLLQVFVPESSSSGIWISGGGRVAPAGTDRATPAVRIQQDQHFSSQVVMPSMNSLVSWRSAMAPVMVSGAMSARPLHCRPDAALALPSAVCDSDDHRTGMNSAAFSAKALIDDGRGLRS